MIRGYLIRDQSYSEFSLSPTELNARELAKRAIRFRPNVEEQRKHVSSMLVLTQILAN